MAERALYGLLVPDRLRPEGKLEGHKQAITLRYISLALCLCALILGSFVVCVQRELVWYDMWYDRIFSSGNSAPLRTTKRRIEANEMLGSYCELHSYS